LAQPRGQNTSTDFHFNRIESLEQSEY